jgi:hypothetical protein
MYRVTEMLETNRYVCGLLIDFSKAFDIVDHEIIVKNVRSFVALKHPQLAHIFSY